jgi:hypothetical protein
MTNADAKAPVVGAPQVPGSPADAKVASSMATIASKDRLTAQAAFRGCKFHKDSDTKEMTDAWSKFIASKHLALHNGHSYTEFWFDGDQAILKFCQNINFIDAALGVIKMSESPEVKQAKETKWLHVIRFIWTADGFTRGVVLTRNRLQ